MTELTKRYLGTRAILTNDDMTPSIINIPNLYLKVSKQNFLIEQLTSITNTPPSLKTVPFRRILWFIVARFEYHCLLNTAVYVLTQVWRLH